MTADPQLVRAAQAGDAAAVEALFREAWPEAYRFAFAITREPASAEDAAQQAFYQAWRALARLRQPEAFGSWLWRLVVREARRASRVGREQPEAEIAAPRTERPVDIDLERALAALSEGDQRLVALAYGMELSSREIGRLLGIPAPTVRFRLGRIRGRLRHELEAESIGGATLGFATLRGGGARRE